MTLQTENLFQNQTALQEFLVPALQNFLQIPQADLETLSNEYPILAPILTGIFAFNSQSDLKVPFFEKILKNQNNSYEEICPKY